MFFPLQFPDIAASRLAILCNGYSRCSLQIHHEQAQILGPGLRIRRQSTIFSLINCRHSNGATRAGLEWKLWSQAA